MMNEFASSRTRGSSDPGRAVTGARRGGFLFLLVSLLVAMALVGCGGGEDPGEDTNVSGESVGQTPTAVTKTPAKTPTSSSCFRNTTRRWERTTVEIITLGGWS